MSRAVREREREYFERVGPAINRTRSDCLFRHGAVINRQRTTPERFASNKPLL